MNSPTLPHSPLIVACAKAVETTLEACNVVLSMGGEPTFVPLQPEGSEWQTAALGPTKLGLARRFAHELIKRTYPGACLLHTSGKHYPGEPLPRWCLLLQWRGDGEPLWRDPSRLKTNGEQGTHKFEHATELMRALLGQLRLPANSALPLNSEGGQASGWVLPLDHDGTGWRTDDWAADLGGDPIKLFPGDSLAGLRLPMALLTEKRLRRALTIEIQEGSVTLFIPPLLMPAYLELIPALEKAIEAVGLHEVILGGYAPPFDITTLPTIGFASDPGVIEINLLPCADWSAYNEQLHRLYAAAAAVGMCARKFQFNGREVGTGGGAHLVFGGPAPETSPFFLHPALLPSVIRYFQHHPALSYAFSGLYMGPSSQAPRIDESTYEALYELEIACEGASRLGSPHNLALYDLLFRDLLMDRSGNTHRAEISVDKLWNPFAGNGRLGLVEFRAFETHPDPALQSLTALFVRAILARLAAAPLSAPFIRWQGALHDRFFLPAFVADDLAAVCADLRAHGIPFQTDWLKPLLEWRFPNVGGMELHYTPPTGNSDDAKSKPPAPVPFRLNFRQALEAWPLLGESPNAGGVARTVDACMDRLEAWVSDVAALEHGLLLVNGYPCPFLKADGGAAGGIRYRAFFLYPSLQPHCPVNAPLLIEWVDKTSLTVVSAARWYVWNPGHSPYTKRPVDDSEAVARRAERWEAWPHTLGEARFIPRIELPPESRHTLDLRRAAILRFG